MTYDVADRHNQALEPGALKYRHCDTSRAHHSNRQLAHLPVNPPIAIPQCSCSPAVSARSLPLANRLLWPVSSPAAWAEADHCERQRVAGKNRG
ncbi:MAG: hypothetical protein ACRYG4_18505 [Janthinobacterium lividum]